MKIKNTVYLLIVVLSSAFFYGGCDDSGITTINQNSTFSSVNLKHLDVSDSAVYEMFVNIDSSGGTIYCSMGKFNINASGQAVDLSGNAKNFQFDFTPNLPTLTDAFVTIEPLSDNDTIPSGLIIMGASRTYVNGVLTYNMNMMYGGALGGIAAQFATDQAQYTFATPTDGSPITQWSRGIWFTTDDFGNSPGISCQSVNSTNWRYHAYVINIANPNYIYNIGKFGDPNAADDFSGCEGNGPLHWQKPGNDWLIPNCPGGGIPDIDSSVAGNLNSSNYKALVTIEPANRPANLSTTPFFIHLFEGNIGVAGYGSNSTLPNVSANFLPTATVTITQKSGQ